MIIFRKINLQKLSAEKKNFKFENPDDCPNCRGRLWGHGYRDCYFEGFTEALPLKRYRCRDCHKTLTLRPSSHFQRFQHSVLTIVKTLKYRLKHFRWPTWARPSTAGYWLTNLNLRILADYGYGSKEDTVKAMKRYRLKNVVFASRLK